MSAKNRTGREIAAREKFPPRANGGSAVKKRSRQVRKLKSASFYNFPFIELVQDRFSSKLDKIKIIEMVEIINSID